MKIETKFNIGDKVKYFKEGVGYFYGYIHDIQVHISHSDLIKTYTIKLKDSRVVRTYEENIKLDK